MSIGIYCFTNLINGKRYIGQSWSIEHRYRQHLYAARTHVDQHLYRSINTYGLKNFSFTVLITLEEGIETQGVLDYFEDYFIKAYDTMNPDHGYNKKEGGSNGRLTDETKLKISCSQRHYEYSSDPYVTGEYLESL